MEWALLTIELFNLPKTNTRNLCGDFMTFTVLQIGHDVQNHIHYMLEWAQYLLFFLSLKS